MAKFFVGVDGGGTTARAVIVDEQGVVLGTAQDGAANPKAVGWQQARSAIQNVITQAWQRGGFGHRAADAVFLGLAGLRLRMEQESFIDYLQPLHLAAEGMLDCDHDLRIALEGGLLGQPGVVLVAGTGSACYGRNDSGASARSGGWGWLLDDAGSGCWMGMEALRAVARAKDGRGPETKLEDMINRSWGQESADEIPVNFYKNPLPRDWVSKLSPLVFECAGKKDRVARTIIRRGAEELALLVKAVVVKLKMENQPVSVVVNGGLVKAGDSFVTPLRAALNIRVSSAVLKQPAMPPVLGAAILAMKKAGLVPDQEILERMRVSSQLISAG